MNRYGWLAKLVGRISGESWFGFAAVFFFFSKKASEDGIFVRTRIFWPRRTIKFVEIKKINNHVFVKKKCVFFFCGKNMITLFFCRGNCLLFFGHLCSRRGGGKRIFNLFSEEIVCFRGRNLFVFFFGGSKHVFFCKGGNLFFSFFFLSRRGRILFVLVKISLSDRQVVFFCNPLCWLTPPPPLSLLPKRALSDPPPYIPPSTCSPPSRQRIQEEEGFVFLLAGRGREKIQ